MGGHGGSVPGRGNSQRPQAGANLRGGGDRKRPKVRIADPGHPAPIGGFEARAQARPAALTMLLVIMKDKEEERGQLWAWAFGRQGAAGGRQRRMLHSVPAPLTVPEEGNAQSQGSQGQVALQAETGSRALGEELGGNSRVCFFLSPGASL